LSSRAAWRLEQLGFDRVYDYTAGKADWLATGLPTEGPGPPAPRVGSVLEPDVPACELGEPAGRAASRAERSGWDLCVVTNDRRIVAGRLRTSAVGRDDARPAEQVMEAGPASVRPHEDLATTLERMRSHHVHVLLVTTPEGELLGALRDPRPVRID
jgi:CBS domain-containing protein